MWHLLDSHWSLLWIELSYSDFYSQAHSRHISLNNVGFKKLFVRLGRIAGARIAQALQAPAQHQHCWCSCVPLTLIKYLDGPQHCQAWTLIDSPQWHCLADHQKDTWTPTTSWSPYTMVFTLKKLSVLSQQSMLLVANVIIL